MKIRRLFIASLLIMFSFSACGPNQGTVEDKEAVKGDTLDVNEGQGEGPVGEGDHK